MTVCQYCIDNGPQLPHSAIHDLPHCAFNLGYVGEETTKVLTKIFNIKGEKMVYKICKHCGLSEMADPAPCKRHNFHEFYDPSEKQKEAIRITRPIRYDILIPRFLDDMARIAYYGAKKYGDFNWQISKLEGDKSSVNHMYKHLTSYRLNEPYDHEELGTQRSLHLVAIAFNAMMEYYWAKLDETAKDK